MRYLLLAYHDQDRWRELSGPEREAFEQACHESEATLRRNGSLSAVESLQSGRQAVTVQPVAGSFELVEGPGAASTDQLVRIFLIEAHDLNEAIRAASQLPEARLGPIELRPTLGPGQAANTQAT